MDSNSFFRTFFHFKPGFSSDPFFPFENERDEINDVDNGGIVHDDFESLDPHISSMFQQIKDMFKMFSTFSMIDFKDLQRCEEILPPQSVDPRSIMLKDPAEEICNSPSCTKSPGNSAKSIYDESGFIGFPSSEEILPPQSVNPRSIMLKDPEEEICDSPSCTKSPGKSGMSIYDESGKELLRKPFSFSYSYSYKKIVRLSDGTVEEHQTVKDKDGNQTTTVRRIIGDTSHEIITQCDKQGFKEKREYFKSMDENERRWEQTKGGDTENLEVPSLNLSETSPFYSNLLKKLFGPFRKEEMKWI